MDKSREATLAFQFRSDALRLKDDGVDQSIPTESFADFDTSAALRAEHRQLPLSSLDQHRCRGKLRFHVMHSRMSLNNRDSGMSQGNVVHEMSHIHRKKWLSVNAREFRTECDNSLSHLLKVAR